MNSITVIPKEVFTDYAQLMLKELRKALNTKFDDSAYEDGTILSWDNTLRKFKGVDSSGNYAVLDATNAFTGVNSMPVLNIEQRIDMGGNIINNIGTLSGVSEGEDFDDITFESSIDMSGQILKSVGAIFGQPGEGFQTIQVQGGMSFNDYGISRVASISSAEVEGGFVDIHVSGSFDMQGYGIHNISGITVAEGESADIAVTGNFNMQSGELKNVSKGQFVSTAEYPEYIAGFSTNVVDGGIALINTNTGGRDWRLLTTSSTSEAPNSFRIYDSTASTGRLCIDQSGNVGLGTDTPNYRLDLGGNEIGGLSAIHGPSQEGEAATGVLQISGGSTDGQQITLDDGHGKSITLTYRDSPSNDTEFGFTIAPFSDYFLADVINRRHSANDIGIHAHYDGNVTIDLTNDVADAAGNVDITTNVSSISNHSGMSGGVDPIITFDVDTDGNATFSTLTASTVSFTPLSSEAVSNNSLFLDTDTGKLSFKDGSGTVNALY